MYCLATALQSVQLCAEHTPIQCMFHKEQFCVGCHALRVHMLYSLSQGRKQRAASSSLPFGFFQVALQPVLVQAGARKL